MERTCVHSCRGLCNALEVAEHREQETLREYRQFVERCDYPDVRVLLEELIREKEGGLRRLRDTRAVLSVRFDALNNINDSFA